MPIVIKAKNNDNTNDVIRKFKKAVAAADVVQKAKDRAFYQKPSQIKAVKKREVIRAHKRLRSLKRQKNVSPNSIAHLLEVIQ